MRIAFLSNANSVHLQEWTEFLVRELSQEVIVLTVSAPELSYAEVPVVHIGGPLFATKLTWPMLVPRVVRELHAFRADILVAYRVVSYGVLGILSGFRPVVLAAQGGNLEHGSSTCAARMCARFALRRADLVHAWSANLRELVVGYGADPQRVLTCSRGIDLKLFSLPFERPLQPLRIVSTRSLTPMYNLEQVISAMPWVLKAEPDAMCHMVGDGWSRKALENLARQLGVTRAVRFHGRLDRLHLAKLLTTVHVYVSTTPVDGLPLSHFEAMAAGVVPVVSDIEANRPWIDSGCNGFLVAVGDAEELASRIVDAYRDQRLRSRAIERNRRLVEEHFDRRVNMSRMVAAYGDLVQRGRRAPTLFSAP